MFFCQKKKKSSSCGKPIVCALALTGLVTLIMLAKKKGAVAKDAIMRAGRKCVDAMDDAAEEIMDCK
jgi:hypothetical protein